MNNRGVASASSLPVLFISFGQWELVRWQGAGRGGVVLHHSRGRAYRGLPECVPRHGKLPQETVVYKSCPVAPAHRLLRLQFYARPCPLSARSWVATHHGSVTSQSIRLPMEAEGGGGRNLAADLFRIFTHFQASIPCHRDVSVSSTPRETQQTARSSPVHGRLNLRGTASTRFRARREQDSSCPEL